MRLIPVIASLILSLSASAFAADAIPAFASNTPWHDNPITVGRCGDPNVKVTLCLAESTAGNHYLAVYTHEPRERVGFITLSSSRVLPQADGTQMEEFQGISPVESPENGGFYEQSFRLSIHTSRSGQNAIATLWVNGAVYYNKFSFEPLRAPAAH